VDWSKRQYAPMFLSRGTAGCIIDEDAHTSFNPAVLSFFLISVST
jgi:hypothetical protein